MMLIKYLPKCEKLFACDTDLFFEFDIADLCSIDNKKTHLIAKKDTLDRSDYFDKEP
jgi:lipopolysaccharide biosynthesis glycosyltransferase